MWKRISIFSLATVMISAAMVQAHGDGKHVLGTVTFLTATQIVVQTREGKTVLLYVLPTTKYRNRSKGAAPGSRDLRVGDRVAVDVTEEGDRLVATEVQFSSHGQKSRLAIHGSARTSVRRSA